MFCKLCRNFGFVVFVGGLLILSCQKQRSIPDYFPETGKKAIYQRSLDLRSNFNVLSIALEPGYEDLATLAYFRLGNGANVLSTYVANGEGGVSDLGPEYPNYLAARRRAEAEAALALLDGGVYFLNMPDIPAARDSASVRAAWSSATLRASLSKLLLLYKPDLILVAKDMATEGESLRLDCLISDLLTAVAEVAPTPGKNPVGGGQSSWLVQSVFVENGGENTLPMAIAAKHPLWQVSYSEIGEQASAAYASLKIQRRRWQRDRAPRYRLLYASPAAKTSAIAIPAPTTPRLHGLEQSIRQISDAAIAGNGEEILGQIVAAMDSISYHLARRYQVPANERRTLLQWNKGLDNLRCAILGVSAKYSFSDTALTASQITFLKITSVTGLDSKGETGVYFPARDQGWIINEALDVKSPLKLNEDYRLISPANVAFDAPRAMYGLALANPSSPFLFFIMHRAPTRERSFIYRCSQNLSFAPRFVTEVLTPMVRMAPNERVVVRLTNYSRDGVADSVNVDDAWGRANAEQFRLNQKNASYTDTLRLSWQNAPADSTYLLPVKIGGITVGQFAARKFAVKVDSSKRIGVINTFNNSILAETLRRLQLPFVAIDLSKNIAEQIQSIDVLLIDTRALSLLPQIAKIKAVLAEVIEGGCHVVVLAQDAIAWQTTPLVEGLHLSPTPRLDAKIPVLVNDTKLASTPNMLDERDWQDWLYRRANNILSGDAVKASTPLLTAQPGGEALAVCVPRGKGKITYVDLDLPPQWMNIHAGAFRVLANLIAY